MNPLALARRALIVGGAAVLALVVQPQSASAHTDLDYTLPADGDTVEAPVDEVTIAFTSPVELVGNGFEALDPQGNVVEPVVATDDFQVFALQFDPPLSGGAAGLRWEVRADDGHVLNGSISFIVEAAAPTTPPPSTAAPTTISPATSPPTTASAAPTPTTTATDAGEASAPAAATTTEAPVVASVPPSSIAGDADGGSNTGLIVAIVAGLAIAAAAFFVIRSRTSTAS